MRKLRRYLFILIIFFAVAIMVSNLNAVNITSQGSVIDGIANYRDMSVNSIIMSKFDEDEFFVLYDDMEGNLHLCIFEKTRFSFDRFYNASGGSSEGNLGEFYFSEGTGNGHKKLTVAYGKSESLNNGSYKVMLEMSNILVDPIEDYFLDVYREETTKSGMIWIEY